MRVPRGQGLCTGGHTKPPSGGTVSCPSVLSPQQNVAPLTSVTQVEEPSPNASRAGAPASSVPAPPAVPPAVPPPAVPPPAVPPPAAPVPPAPPPEPLSASQRPCPRQISAPRLKSR